MEYVYISRILVKQFRAGTNSDTLEFPGGSINKNEDIAHAAARELQEETGAVSGSIIPLGVIDPNPAFMTNKCYAFAALDCTFDGVQQLDLFRVSACSELLNQYKFTIFCNRHYYSPAAHILHSKYHRFISCFIIIF